MKLPRILVPLFLGLLVACGEDPVPARETAATPPGETVHPQLKAVLPEMVEKIYPVTDGVYQAVGFGGANSIMIEGDDGIVVVDAMGSVESGEKVMRAFRDITDKPLKAIIYTHNHGDHTFGGPGMIRHEASPEAVQVWAHDSTSEYIDRVVNVLAPVIGARSNRMIGALLPPGDEGFVHYGLANEVETAMPGNHPGLLRPTHTFSDEVELEIAGIRLRLIHVMGETDDQILVWLPDHRVIMPGDNVYKSFPNLYTLRGTSYRDIKAWYQSVDTMLALEPEFMAPSHTLPVAGREAVADVLTAYRDGIQFVHDQTIRGMNKGLTPDELVEVVKLPEHLASHPYLFEYYGKVEWAVRNIYNGYLGWYDANVSNLLPPAPDEEAALMARLAGGEAQLLAAAQQAFEEGNYPWTLKLTDYLLRLEPSSEEYRELRARAATLQGYRMHNANARNIYLTEAAELRGVEQPEEEMQEKSNALIKAMPVKGFIEAMAVNLNPEKSIDQDEKLSIAFTDTGEAFTLHVRRGVAIVSEGEATDARHRMKTTSTVWLEIMAGDRSLPGALATADIELDGGRVAIPRTLGFLAMFSG